MVADAYRTLGLEPGASSAEVKRAYRRLAKANHPDSAGPAALPRFLAIHDAYERLTNGRGPGRAPAGSGRGGAAASTGAASGPEPWRADPSRARAAREQARARNRTGTATGAGGAGGAGGNARAGGPAGTAGRSAAGSTRGAGTAGGRRRATRKATMGSTSYDEARDPADTTWAGASWYGPTSGEYWRVNPREYADPRKHGPEYQSRARRQSTTSGAGWAEAADATEDGSPEEPVGARDAEAQDAAGARGPDPARAWSTPPKKDRDLGIGLAADDAESGLASLARLLETDRRDPIRRLGFALLGWAPIGLAVAAVIGASTGCAVYRADCVGLAPFMPWLAQAIILGLLMLLPRLARILSVGALAVVLALVPGALFIIAFGGSGQPEAAAALGVILALVWLGGVALGVVATGRASPGAASR